MDALPAPPELTELIAPPAAGRVFERRQRPGIADSAPDGRARIDAIARWLQDIAYSDIVDAGFADRGFWVVRRTRIRVERFPEFGEDLVLRTYCSGLGRFSAERRTDIEGESASVSAVAVWVCLDSETRRPRRHDPDLREAYEESAQGRPAPVGSRHPPPPADAPATPWHFRAVDLDVAGHVNNSHYWEPLEERLMRDEAPDSIDAELEHREPAEAGEVAVIESGAIRWITSSAGEVHASIVVGPPPDRQSSSLSHGG
jgi:acyl-ACP thioesterase